MSTLATILARGTKAAQPAATAVPIGSLYMVTDSNNIERSTGAAWQVVVSGRRTVVKAADETIVNNTLQDDNELLMTVEINSVYTFEMCLILTNASVAGADFKYGFTLPASATLSSTNYGLDMTAANPGSSALANSGQAAGAFQQTTPTAARNYGVSISSVYCAVWVKGVIRTGATAGTVTLQWAQSVTDAVGTVVKADSYLTLEKVS